MQRLAAVGGASKLCPQASNTINFRNWRSDFGWHQSAQRPVQDVVLPDDAWPLAQLARENTSTGLLLAAGIQASLKRWVGR